MPMRPLACLLVFLLAAGGPGRPAKEEPREKEILDHIRSIFEGFLRKDRQVLRRTHAADWVGFLGPSSRIERGIEDYMNGAELSLESFDGIGYEILDHEVRFYGDTGIVFYTARYDYRDTQGREQSLPLRSLDIYRRGAGRVWVQVGSHITVIPRGGSWGEGNSPGGPEGATE